MALSTRPGGYTALGSRRRRGRWRQVDWALWGVPVGLSLLAGVLIASTQRQEPSVTWWQHWLTAAVGMGLGLALAGVPVERIARLRWPIYGATVASLVLVRLIGTSALGAQSWISIGGFYVQPSEFAKLAAILLLAEVLARHPIERPIDLLRPTAMIGMPWLLVFVQPDLGTSLVFGAVLLTMLFWAGMPLAWLVLLLSPLVSAIVAGTWAWGLLAWIPAMGLVAWRSLPWRRTALAMVLAVQGLFAVATPWLWQHGLKPHQRERLTMFLDPSQDPLGGGYHLIQSQIGIGSGGIWGTGLLHGQLTKLRFIPEQHTDFIFSALGEETGFVGSVLVVAAFALLMARLLRIAARARTDLESLVVVGVGAMLMFQVVVNVNMTIGLGPITGIPLPWLSYGRFAMLVNFLGIGLVSSVERRSRPSARRW
ncbi:MAG: rod shape-determining protein RodA [Cyanobium sp.]